MSSLVRSLSVTLSLAALLVAPLTSMSSEKAVKTIAFTQDTVANDWRKAQVEEITSAFEGVEGVKFITTVADGDSSRQILDSQNFITTGIDVLITSPIDANAMTLISQLAKQKNVPLVLISRGVNDDNYTSFIHPDNHRIAGQAARYIAKRLEGKGSVLILQHIPTTTVAIQRTQGFFEALEDYPDIKIADIRVANSQRSEAIIQTQNAILEGLKFDAIYAQSDSMAIGAVMALKKHGIDPKNIVITGIDYISEARELIRRGELDASYTYPTAGREGAQVALDILAGKDVDKEIVIDSTEVTLDNVESVEPIF